MGGEVGRSLPGGGAGCRTLAASFVDAGAADVPHPFDDVVVTVVELGLKHLQVAHLQTRRRKRNLQGTRGRSGRVGACWETKATAHCGIAFDP